MWFHLSISDRYRKGPFRRGTKPKWLQFLRGIGRIFVNFRRPGDLKVPLEGLGVAQLPNRELLTKRLLPHAVPTGRIGSIQESGVHIILARLGPFGFPDLIRPDSFPLQIRQFSTAMPACRLKNRQSTVTRSSSPRVPNRSVGVVPGPRSPRAERAIAPLNMVRAT